MPEYNDFIELDGRILSARDFPRFYLETNKPIKIYKTFAQNFILICEELKATEYYVLGFFMQKVVRETDFEPLNSTILQKMAEEALNTLYLKLGDSSIVTWYDWISKCYNAECQAPAIIEVNSSMLYDQYDGRTYHFRNKTLAEKYRKLVNESRGFTNG